jgi:hypothetical protein
VARIVAPKRARRKNSSQSTAKAVRITPARPWSWAVRGAFRAPIAVDLALLHISQAAESASINRPVTGAGVIPRFGQGSKLRLGVDDALEDLRMPNRSNVLRAGRSMRVTVTTSPGASVSSIGRGSFPTEVLATASGFVYHQGAIFVGLVGPVRAYLVAVSQTGFAIPMPVGTVLGVLSFTLATLLGPETRAKELVPDLIVA